MKILHAAALLRPPPGILNQMAWEQSAAHALGIQWHVRLYCPKGAAPDSNLIQHASAVESVEGRSALFKLFAWARLRRDYHRWLLQVEHEYDALLLRYYVHDPFQLAFIRRATKPVYLVHHTLEGPELAADGGVIASGRAWAENWLGGRTIRRARRVICVTPEIGRYELARAKGMATSAVIYPNGIVYSGEIARDGRGDVPQLLFVASGFSAWHGLDRLLASMKHSAGRFVLHLVGTVGDDDRAVAKLDPRIRMHGRLSSEAISQLAAQCDVGLSSFALDRQQMSEACTLKVREYLMLGLPVYAGYREVLPDDFPYYRRGPADVEAIVRFAQDMRAVSRQTVSVAARPHIDKRALLAGLMDDLQRDCDNEGWG